MSAPSESADDVRGAVWCRCAERPDLAYFDSLQRMTKRLWDEIGPTDSFPCPNKDCDVKLHTRTKVICKFVPDRQD